MVKPTRQLDVLYEISRILASPGETRGQLGALLGFIAEEYGLERGAITLLDRRTGELWIEVAHGMTLEEARRGRYRLGEGITGRVVETGKPVAVPKLGSEPTFLDKTGVRANLDKDKTGFLCVPIKVGAETIGALSVDRESASSNPVEDDLQLLGIIAAMVAQAAGARQALEEERRKLVQENIHLRHELADRFQPSNIVGTSSAMQTVYDLIARVAPTDTTALIRGESGTGKELVASAVHYASARAGKAFVKVHCAALPETLLESELFGHEKGAFTGALSRRRGHFEAADGGTILLDEVGDFSPAVQVKLLRILQERELQRLGSSETIRVNVRIIAATNKNLEKLMIEGKFREDLYYRLNVFGIFVPPLRERRSDILLLADHFLEKYARRYGKDIKRISTPAIDLLMIYHWPGNVRELENAVEHAVVMSNEGAVHAYHLPPTLQSAESSDTSIEGSLAGRVAQLEQEMAVEALKEFRGNCTKAAKALGTTVRILNYKLKKLGVDPARFRLHTDSG